jgi:hypothetical protein
MIFSIEPRKKIGTTSVAYWEDFLTEEDINKILNLPEWNNLKEGRVGNEIVNTKVRDSKINWISLTDENLEIYKKISSIAPLFNRMVMFTCNDYAWHGNPESATCPSESKRIFVTISYLSENFEDENKRVKAFFIPRPSDPENLEKEKLRFLRTDPGKYKEIYRVDSV